MLSRASDRLVAALKTLPPKPPDTADRGVKQRYSQKFSETVAVFSAEELRNRGLMGARPGLPGEMGVSGAERRIAGGVGAKKVDVTWATEESGLLLAVSVKSIHFRDQKSNTFQKNLTNRRGDMVFESLTLHRRFPYAVLGGFLFLDHEAEHDGSNIRRATFLNAHHRLRLFTGRSDPAGRDEQYERCYIALVGGNRPAPSARFFLAGKPDEEVTLAEA